MMTTMEQAVTQLQQEHFTIRAQITSVMAEAVRAIDNFTTAQAQKYAPNLIDVNGVRGNFLVKNRISNNGQRRRRHSSLE